jgi:hypothetical protein
MVFQEIGYFLGVGDVAFNAQGQGFEALDEQPCVERADAMRRGRGGLWRGYAGYEAGTRDVFGEADTIVGFVRRSEFLNRPEPAQSNSPFSTMRPPRVVPWPPMNFVAEWTNDVSTVFERAEEERRSKGVIYDDRDAVFVGDFSDGFEIRNVDGRIAQAFQVYGFRLVV